MCCRAQEIGDILMRAFDTPTGIPHGTINLKSLRSYNPSWAGGASGEVQALQRHDSQGQKCIAVRIANQMDASSRRGRRAVRMEVAEALHLMQLVCRNACSWSGGAALQI